MASNSFTVCTKCGVKNKTSSTRCCKCGNKLQKFDETAFVMNGWSNCDVKIYNTAFRVSTSGNPIQIGVETPTKPYKGKKKKVSKAKRVRNNPLNDHRYVSTDTQNDIYPQDDETSVSDHDINPNIFAIGIYSNSEEEKRSRLDSHNDQRKKAMVISDEDQLDLNDNMHHNIQNEEGIVDHSDIYGKSKCMDQKLKYKAIEKFKSENNEEIYVAPANPMEPTLAIADKKQDDSDVPPPFPASEHASVPPLPFGTRARNEVMIGNEAISDPDTISQLVTSATTTSEEKTSVIYDDDGDTNKNTISVASTGTEDSSDKIDNHSDDEVLHGAWNDEIGSIDNNMDSELYVKGKGAKDKILERFNGDKFIKNRYVPEKMPKIELPSIRPNRKQNHK